MKKNIVLMITLFSLYSSLAAQQHLTVSMDDPVYHLIEIAELRGILQNIPQYRPFSRSLIISYLDKIEAESARLTAVERSLLASERNRLTRVKQDPLADGVAVLSEDDLLPLRLRWRAHSATSFELGETELHNEEGVTLNIEGDVADFLSYRAMGGFGFIYSNRLAFAPYEFSRNRFGTTISFDDSSSSNQNHQFDEEKTPGLSFYFAEEIQSSFFDGRLQLGINFHRRDYGVGEGNLSLSKTARPFLGLDLHLHPVEWVGLNFVTGSLHGENENGSPNSMFSLQQFEFFITRWVYFSFMMEAVWPKRFELMYMTPLLPLIMVQNTMNNNDNIATELALAVKLPYIKLYGVLFADEVQPQNITTIFSDPKQQFAFQLGVKGVIPGLPFTTALFQYTKIEPYAYTHYAERQPSVGDVAANSIINVSWMNDSENLGYNLQPNSDEFKIRLQSLPLEGLMVFLQYQHIRHGDGDPARGEMEGRTDAQFTPGDDTSIYDDDYFGGDYPQKDFLNDGPYELIHTVSLGGSYQFKNIPLRLNFGYTFSHNNNAGLYKGVNGEAQFYNIFALGAILYY